MGKNVYSLVLSDEVVAAIDALATREGYSRSALINHVLAEYASLQTPEKWMRQTIAAAHAASGRAGFRGAVSAGGTLTLYTALRYKYNPSLNYVVELWDDEQDMGRFRVLMRSQNARLLEDFELFFQLWGRLEQSHLPAPPPQTHSRLEAQRYARTLRRPPDDATQSTGEAIADYVNMLDACMKTFFGLLHDMDSAAAATEKAYRKALAAHEEIQAL